MQMSSNSYNREKNLPLTLRCNSYCDHWKGKTALIGMGTKTYSLFIFNRQDQLKRSTQPGFSLCPDKSIMIGSNLSGNGKAYTCSLVFRIAMKSLEHVENDLGLLLCKAYSVI